MEHFNETIGTSEGNLIFYFNRMFTANGLRFHVSVVDKNRKLVSFKMLRDNSKWLIENKDGCPHWIISLEGELSEVIMNSL